MPGKSGFELLQWIRGRKELKDLPVLITTSSEDQDQIKKAYDLGATSFFPKSGGYSDITDFLRNTSEK
jgi:DNA-binding NarL/FixJ family response regulator